MSRPTRTFPLSSPDHTGEMARVLAHQLLPGDVVLLNGPIGAGKSHFSRHLISAILLNPEDIPSPTFTLVQTYDTLKGELWHCDLYRVSSFGEIEELGLTQAFQDTICLVEWPDRLGPLTPATALTLELSQGADEDSRTLTAKWSDDKWTSKIDQWVPT